MDFAVSENLIAGNASEPARLVPVRRDARAGRERTGRHGSRQGRVERFPSLIPPTDIIKEDWETRTIDGVTVEFHLTPGTERQPRW